MKNIILACLLMYATFVNAGFRRPEEFNPNTTLYAGCTVGENADDTHLINRIIAAYQLAKKEHLGNSMWQIFFDSKHKPIDTVFQKGIFDQCANVLRNPIATDLFYGIDNLCASTQPIFLDQGTLIQAATHALDNLIRLGEAIGAISLDNPELYSVRPIRKWNANRVLKKIESRLGLKIFFPNPYPNEVGICTNNGVASYRAIQGIYQAYLIKELTKGIENPKILEIGAGVGRTAYYARTFGIKDYTIIDIPMTILSSSYFLGRTLGEDQIVLLGESEENSEEKIKILTPDQFLNNDQKYDLIINVDSLTEMDHATMLAYVNKIKDSTPTFVSINHEINAHTVNEVIKTVSTPESFERKPYWMRIGYAEEIYRFKN